MSSKLRVAAAFMAAVIATALLMSIFSTQIVIGLLSSVGAKVALGERISMTLADLKLLQLGVPIVAACFAVAFPIARLGYRKIGGARTFWFCCAGACSVLSVWLLAELALQLMPLAGARTTFGLVLQGLAGLIGGFVFTRLAPFQSNSSTA